MSESIAIAQRTINLIKIGDDNCKTVTLRFKGSSRLTTAVALEVGRDASGAIAYLCLDRLIHRNGESVIRVADPGWAGVGARVSGCVVTEMFFDIPLGPPSDFPG